MKLQKAKIVSLIIAALLIILAQVGTVTIVCVYGIWSLGAIVGINLAQVIISVAAGFVLLRGLQSND